MDEIVEIIEEILTNFDFKDAAEREQYRKILYILLSEDE